jgi:hypothetical protein
VTNDAPDGGVSVHYGGSLSPTVTVLATDPDTDGSKLTASAVGLPAGMSLTVGATSADSTHPGTRTWTVTGAVTASPGVFPVTVTVTDDTGEVGTTSFTITVTKAPLTVTADDKSRLFGAANPPLTATLSGFVLGQTLATSGVTGTASCTTTARVYSAGGDYPITCTVGTLTAVNYSFATFVPGTLTVTFTRPCLTGTAGGPLTVSVGQAICIGPGGVQSGPVTVNPGGLLDVEGGTIAAPLRSTGAAVLRLCGATVTGPLTVTGTTGLVLVGGDAATGTCAGNTIGGPASLTGNTGGVEFNGNDVAGPLTVTGNTGSLPPPDAGSVHVTGNTVAGPVKVQ